MATKDVNIGLLSKVARFVRNPTKDWSDLDKPELEPENGYSKQSLKEMIERKRQNDFVRRREFDQLRKLRRNEHLVNPERAGPLSFFQSSIPSNPNERATTLKKIDEIEAQMSKQWWKGKQDDAAGKGASADVPTRPPVASDAGAAISSTPESVGDLFATTQAPDAVHDLDALASARRVTVGGASAPPAADSRSTGVSRLDAGSSDFSSSKLFSIEMGDALTDPDLEEAAIRFANGDDAGAEAGLLAVLQASDVGSEAVEGWASALFDLYRATGQQASFDRVAIDCAQRFGRSAPGWFSIPELLGRVAAVAPLSSAVGAPRGLASVWACPVELDLSAVSALRAWSSGVPARLQLDWRRLAGITPDAAKALADLFAEWCVTAVKLHFAGVENLERTLKHFTPSGDKNVASCWWGLRLDALRILRLQDEFELAALEYCVTFEVSPPAWEDARCDCVHAQGNAAGNDSGRHPSSSVDACADTGPATTVLMALDSAPVPVVELTGEVLGDAAEALNKFQAGLVGSDRLVVSCSRLIRVDFSAAGSILNWVATRESEGCQVQFRDVPRLVAVFFNVIGINEHARIILRTN
jgi:ABC-type transporter Mla MlaB component